MVSMNSITAKKGALCVEPRETYIERWAKEFSAVKTTTSSKRREIYVQCVYTDITAYHDESININIKKNFETSTVFKILGRRIKAFCTYTISPVAQVWLSSLCCNYAYCAMITAYIQWWSKEHHFSTINMNNLPAILGGQYVLDTLDVERLWLRQKVVTDTMVDNGLDILDLWQYIR